MLRLQVSAKVFAVEIAFLEVLWSLRSFNRLIAGSIVAEGGFVRRSLWPAKFS